MRNINENTDIYKLFGITDDKKLLFSKMEKEWSILPENNEIKSYEINPIDIFITADWSKYVK